jgi:hypothetical protein
MTSVLFIDGFLSSTAKGEKILNVTYRANRAFPQGIRVMSIKRFVQASCWPRFHLTGRHPNEFGQGKSRPTHAGQPRKFPVIQQGFTAILAMQFDKPFAKILP